MKDPAQDEVNMKEIVISFRNLITYFISKWVIIVILGFSGVLVGYLMSYKAKFSYTGTMVFALEDEKSGGGGGLSSLASQFGFDVGGGGASGVFAGANLIELLKSRSLVEKTLLNPVTLNGKQLSLAEYYIQINGWRKKWEDNPVFANMQFPPNAERKNFTRNQDSVMGLIYGKLTQNNLRVGQSDKKVSFLYITVVSEDELFSKYMVEALAAEVSEFYIDSKSKKSKINVAIIEHQVDSIRRELNSSISGVAAATDNTFNLNPMLNIKRVQSSVRQVDVQANSAILTEMVKNLELAKISLRKETPLIQIVDRPILPLVKSRTSKLKSMEIGGLIGGLIALLFLVVRRWWKKNITV